MSKNKKIAEYPRIKELGLDVKSGIVNRYELNDKLRELKLLQKFSKMFGIQTQTIDGPWASDVEAVLERLKTGKRTGTQHPLLWD